MKSKAAQKDIRSNILLMDLELSARQISTTASDTLCIWESLVLQESLGSENTLKQKRCKRKAQELRKHYIKINNLLLRIAPILPILFKRLDKDYKVPKSKLKRKIRIFPPIK